MKNAINQPTLESTIYDAIEEALYSFNCHRIGIIDSYDATNQLANVRIVDKGVIGSLENQRLIDYPPLIDCPVIINKSSKGGLTIPINEGDSCIILFNDRNMDNWLIDGQIQQPATLRKHNISDAIVLVGIRSRVNKIDDYNNNSTSLNYENKKITLDNEGINLNADSGKLDLKNTTESLKGLLDELINTLTNLKVTDPISGPLPIDPGTASSLSSITSKISSLLK